MKIALYIEDGLEQIVLTPQSETEYNILKKLERGERTVEIKAGSFYPCQGGWVRQRSIGNMYQGFSEADDESTMIIMRATPPEKD